MNLSKLKSMCLLIAKAAFESGAETRRSVEAGEHPEVKSKKYGIGYGDGWKDAAQFIYEEIEKLETGEDIEPLRHEHLH